ncbi:MAG: hypothetical protein HQL05_13645 [Nitrospirae bacterium]|uniref:hypothetical protein n=1 Tax=Candidatus Magnetobacterium casense TaxID=1455061 RepID=UPI00058BE5CC|nr:hypothetical protein [Candidatus Magnetobacterium casensis]MBF0338859.1 hypothetical protein [Nitrospirota bacterium]
MFLKKELFEQYLKDVDMMPKTPLGEGEGQEQELTEDDYKKSNWHFREKLQNKKEKISILTVALMCFLGLICLFSMYFLFSNSARLSGNNLASVYKYTIVLLLAISVMLMVLRYEKTVFTMSLLQNS